MALLSTTALTRSAFAQADSTSGESVPFSFDILTDEMRDAATRPYEVVTAELPSFLNKVDYDLYRKIQYRPERSKWIDEGPFRLQAFHMGWLFKEPVQVYEVADGNATMMTFSTDDFEYMSPELKADAHEELPGIAGWRVNYPLNEAGKYDELVSFLGASYFRALGRGNVYGLSARGIVLNSWVDGPEEFPRFSKYYAEKQVEGQPLVISAALEGESVTGAYQFKITPGNDDSEETVMEVTARLFFRKDVVELGIAPLTSMFLFADNNRVEFDDYRPQVHDSHGLVVENHTGEQVWRALNNPKQLGNTYVKDLNPRAFGLYQRDRDFDNYQDAGAHYERRPSLRVEPIGEWGEGAVRLIEIPSQLEAEDNIGAFWVPSDPVKAGDEREFSYRLKWGNLNPSDTADLAYVVDTRTGQGGVSGIANDVKLRKFVVDFRGGALTAMDPEAELEVVTSISGGKILVSALSKIDANNDWRLVLDIEPEADALVELRAHIAGMEKVLTETWLYQWRAA